MARTAVITGTATAVSGGMMRRAQRRQLEREEAAAYRDAQGLGVPATPSTTPEPRTAEQRTAAIAPDPMIEKLKELAALHSSGVLSDEEFAAAKAKLLG